MTRIHFEHRAKTHVLSVMMSADARDSRSRPFAVTELKLRRDSAPSCFNGTSYHFTLAIYDVTVLASDSMTSETGDVFWPSLART